MSHGPFIVLHHLARTLYTLIVVLIELSPFRVGAASHVARYEAYMRCTERHQDNRHDGSL